MWLLGPRDPTCSISDPCPGKGVLFDFTEDPFSGTVEPFFNQMWFTLALLLIMFLNWPFCKVMFGQFVPVWLFVPWIGTSIIYAALIAAAGSDCHQPWILLLWLTACEAAFLA